MPYLKLQFKQKVTEEKQEKLAKELTIMMDSIMGKKQKVTAVDINDNISGNWYINGQKQSIAVHLDIYITNGTNTEKEKSEMITKANQLIKNVVGVIPEASYIIIKDIEADSWGFDGLTQKERKAKH
jgi:4-oxalocrotonate tautomerase